MIFGKDEQIRVRIFWVHDNYSIKFFANRFHTSTLLEVFTKIFNEITMLQNLFGKSDHAKTFNSKKHIRFHTHRTADCSTPHPRVGVPRV